MRVAIPTVVGDLRCGGGLMRSASTIRCPNEGNNHNRGGGGGGGKGREPDFQEAT